MITQIATVAVYVDDQQKAKDFWTKQVGFEVRAERAMGPGGSWLEVAPPGAQTCIVLYPKTLMDKWEQLRPSLVFSCDDVTKTHAAMAASGVKFTQEPKQMPWGTFATFVDLDGNEFILKG